ncbi:hypothetical protein N7540_005630 [Penicillium herquei]|nr:hypothetical protein N7540_005630 [Penicillium herquei]
MSADSDSDGSVFAKIPPPVVGIWHETVKPGTWAKYLHDPHWPKEQAALADRASIIHEMRNMPIIREPTVTSRLQNITSEDFWRQLNERRANIEAIHLQSKGFLLSADDACDSCSQGSGKFSGCVVLLDSGWILVQNQVGQEEPSQD